MSHRWMPPLAAATALVLVAATGGLLPSATVDGGAAERATAVLDPAMPDGAGSDASATEVPSTDGTATGDAGAPGDSRGTLPQAVTEGYTTGLDVSAYGQAMLEQYAGDIPSYVHAGPLALFDAGLSFDHPVAGPLTISSSFGWRMNPTDVGPAVQFHIGQDYAIACGTPVRAAADGLVVSAGERSNGDRRVDIDHGSGLATSYRHNSRLLVSPGDRVSRGDLISLSGTTGNSTGCHLHFDVAIEGKYVDPVLLLPAIAGQPRPLNAEELQTLRTAADQTANDVSRAPSDDIGQEHLQWSAAGPDTRASPPRDEHLAAGDAAPAPATPRTPPTAQPAPAESSVPPRERPAPSTERAESPAERPVSPAETAGAGVQDRPAGTVHQDGLTAAPAPAGSASAKKSAPAGSASAKKSAPAGSSSPKPSPTRTTPAPANTTPAPAQESTKSTPSPTKTAPAPTKESTKSTPSPTKTGPAPAKPKGTHPTSEPTSNRPGATTPKPTPAQPGQSHAPATPPAATPTAAAPESAASAPTPAPKPTSTHPVPGSPEPTPTAPESTATQPDPSGSASPASPSAAERPPTPKSLTKHEAAQWCLPLDDENAEAGTGADPDRPQPEFTGTPISELVDLIAVLDEDGDPEPVTEEVLEQVLEDISPSHLWLESLPVCSDAEFLEAALEERAAG